MRYERALKIAGYDGEKLDNTDEKTDPKYFKWLYSYYSGFKGLMQIFESLPEITDKYSVVISSYVQKLWVFDTDESGFPIKEYPYTKDTLIDSLQEAIIYIYENKDK